MNKKQVGISALIGAMIASIVYIEGGYTDDPYDPGGQTKYGITEKTAREFGYKGKMKDLPLETANEIYKVLYVEQPGFDQFIEINPAIAHKLIDAGVNVGTARVTVWLQRALNTFSQNGKNYPVIAVDGILGPNTLKAYKALEQVRGKEKACKLILKTLDGYQTNYYLSLTQYNRYITGWIDKRIENIPLDQCRKYNLVLPLISEEDENK